MTELRKVIKLRTVISASTGMAIATSSYVAGIQIATILVGELAWISILLAGFLCLLSSMCFSELTSLYPSAAGIKLYIQNAFNEKVSIIIGMFYVILGICMVLYFPYRQTWILLQRKDGENSRVLIRTIAPRSFNNRGEIESLSRDIKKNFPQ